jgi:hypothetical protein
MKSKMIAAYKQIIESIRGMATAYPRSVSYSEEIKKLCEKCPSDAEIILEAEESIRIGAQYEQV